MRSANRLARELGLNKRGVFTAEQYRLFVSGKGNGGDQADARLVRASRWGASCAVAPDLYYWGRRTTCMIAFIREIGAMNKRTLGDTTNRRVRSQPLSDLDAARDWLAQREEVIARLDAVTSAGKCPVASVRGKCPCPRLA